MKRKYLQRQRIEGFWFVLPALLFMAFMIGYPIVYNIILSFKNLSVATFRGNTSVFVGLENYRELFQSKEFGGIFWNTFVFTVVSLVFQFSIGFALALLFSRKFPGAKPARGLLLIAYMMPVSVSGLLFRNMFGTDIGVINDLMLKLHLITSKVSWLTDPKTALSAVIFANCWIGIPFNMLLLSSGLSTIPQDIYESAKIDGAGAFRRFISITLPLLKPNIIATLTLGFIYTFRVFDIVYIMTNGGPLNVTTVMSIYAYRLSFTNYNFSLGAAAANVLIVCLFCIGLIYLRLQAKGDEL